MSRNRLLIGESCGRGLEVTVSQELFRRLKNNEISAVEVAVRRYQSFSDTTMESKY